MPPDSGEIESSDNSSSEAPPTEATLPPETASPSDKSDRSPIFSFKVTIPKFESYSYTSAPLPDGNTARFHLRVETTYDPSDPELYFNTAYFGANQGGYPTVILSDGTELSPMPQGEYSEKYYEERMSKGDSFLTDWYFALPSDFVSGKYDIKVSCLGNVATFSGIEISPDTCDYFNNALFDFDIEIAEARLVKAEDLYYSDVDMIEIAMKVTTVCTSGRYKLLSAVSPGFDGGIPVLILPDGSEIKHDPVDVSPAYDKVDIKKGDKTERIWRFMLTSDFVSGEYDIRVDLDNGLTKLFEDVLIEFKE